MAYGDGADVPSKYDQAAKSPATRKKDPYSPVKLDTSGISKQYEAERQRISSRENANQQTQKDAIARRMAQLGGGPGGAFIKLENQVNDQSAQRVGEQNLALSGQEAAALQDVKRAEEQMNFARQERMSSQDFQSAENLSAREAAAKEAAEARKWQTEEGSRNRYWQSGESKLARDLQKSQFGQQMDLSWKQFAHEQFVDDFNMKMAEKMFNKKDMLEQFFGNFSGSSISGGWKSMWGGDSIFSGDGGF